jgi:hypothetical protein
MIRILFLFFVLLFIPFFFQQEKEVMNDHRENVKEGIVVESTPFLHGWKDYTYDDFIVDDYDNPTWIRTQCRDYNHRICEKEMIAI